MANTKPLASQSRFTQAGTGAVERTVQDKLQDQINVKDFGADPSASGATNTAAFQAALNSLSGSASAKLIVPRGTFVLATPVTVPSNVAIIGAGKSSTILRCTQRIAANGRPLSQTIFSGANVSNVTIEGILFDGAVPPIYYNGDNLAPQALIDFSGSSYITIRDCDFTKFFANLPTGYVYSDATYKLGSIFMYDCSKVVVERCEYLYPSYGNLTMILECDNITLNGLRSTWDSDYNATNESPINVWGVTTQNVTIENCVFAHTDGSAINLGGIGNFIVQNNRLTDCVTPIDLSNENWVDPATHPNVYNVIVQNNAIINPAGTLPAIQVGDVRAGEAVSTHEVVVANNQVQMSTSATTALVVGNSDFVTITGNTLNGCSIQSQYNNIITINNNIINGRGASGANKAGVLYYCRTEQVLSYAYIKNNVISYWEDGAIEVLGFFGGPYTRLAITDNEFVFPSVPTNGQYITVTPSGGNPAYRPGILMINNNRLNMVDYVPFRDTDTAISADTLLFGSLSVKVGSFTRDMSLASGTQAVTGVGFKPKAIIFLANVNNTGQTSIGIGALPNTATGPFGSVSLNSRNATAAGTWSTNAGVVFAYQSGSAYYNGGLSSLDSDGFTMSWTKTGATTGTLEVNYIAFQ